MPASRFLLCLERKIVFRVPMRRYDCGEPTGTYHNACTGHGAIPISVLCAASSLGLALSISSSSAKGRRAFLQVLPELMRMGFYHVPEVNRGSSR